MNAAVSISGLTKIYQKDSEAVQVLQGIDLSVAEGDYLALMGPSGSGKTTLLNLIAGIDKPTEGRVIVAGSDITPLNEDELARWRNQTIGFVFQFYNLLPVLSALENVELPLLLTYLSKAERRKRAVTALNIVGLGDRLEHLPRQLSGGQEQRVGIARAIVADPLLIVADEPTGDLDAKAAEEVLELFATLNRDFKKTIIMVTHDPKAAEHANRIIHLEKGRLVRAA